MRELSSFVIHRHDELQPPIMFTDSIPADKGAMAQTVFVQGRLFINWKRWKLSLLFVRRRLSKFCLSVKTHDPHSYRYIARKHGNEAQWKSSMAASPLFERKWFKNKYLNNTYEQDSHYCSLSLTYITRPSYSNRTSIWYQPCLYFGSWMGSVCVKLMQNSSAEVLLKKVSRTYFRSNISQVLIWESFL